VPRTARIKSPIGIYHVMIRSISDTSLFKDNDDKDRYLELIKKYQNLFLFRVYAYCVMTTHAHFIIDCAGADISKFMKAINLSYAAYFNKKYNRHGHVFQDRFKSKVIADEKYLLMLSAYIHNNVKDAKNFKNCIEKYRYSSLGIFLGVNKDSHNILTPDYILHHFGSTTDKSRKLYLKFIIDYSDNTDSSISNELEFINDISEYKSERKILLRNYSTEDIVSFISSYVKTPFNIHIKYNHKNSELRAVCAVLMRSLSNFTLKEIAAVLGNVTLSNIHRLCTKGLNLITENDNYKPIVSELLRSCPIT
jgi:putative transposase